MSEGKVIAMSNREIRSYAREKLLGNMMIPCLVTFFFFSAKNLFSLIMQLGILGKDTFSFIFYMVVFLAVNSVWGLVQYGITRYFLAFTTSKKANPGNVFAGLKISTNTILGVSLILSIISLICQLPYIVYAFFLAPDTIQGMLVSLIILLAGNIASYFISICFAPIYFIICDYPDMGPALVFIMNFSLMNRKNYFKYLGLQISFIPFYLLGFLSFGIGLLWVVPYAYTAYAYFYEDLCESYLKNNNPNKNASEN